MKESTRALFELEGKVAIITGSSKGIGLSIARSFAEYGAKVVLSSRSQEAVDTAAAVLQAEGYEVMAQACHVGDAEQRSTLVEKTVAHFSGVDILVNNAAINPVYSSIEQVETAVFDKMFNINVKAAFELSNLCFPHMKAGNYGSVINIASVEGLKPSFGLGVYSMTKSTLIMMTQVQAKEWGKHGIRSNAICPGLIKTKFSSDLWQNKALVDQLTNQLPAGRVAASIEMSGIAVYLASEASSYTTGGVFTADGGFMTI